MFKYLCLMTCVYTVGVLLLGKYLMTHTHTLDILGFYNLKLLDISLYAFMNYFPCSDMRKYEM